MEQQEETFAKGYNFYKIFWIFLILALAGDLIEVVFCRFSMGRWMSRSSLLYGQFSIVWGMAGVLLTILLKRMQGKKDLYIFLGGTVLGGLYEYFCCMGTEYIFGVRFWDYSKYSLNFQGRINLLFCFFWGMIALLWVRNLYPRISRQIERIPSKVGKPLTWAMAVLMTVNICLSASALARFSERQNRVEAEGKVDEFLDECYPDGWMIQRYSNMKLRSTDPLNGERTGSWTSPLS